MRKLTKILFLILLLSAIRYPLSATFAGVPHLINYQGRLTDKQNKPLEGAYAITFIIYDSESAGSLLWEETQSVVIQKGIFNVLLGSVSNLNLPFDKACFLTIKVGNEVMAPRQRITSTGYAIRAETAEVAERAKDAEKVKADSADPATGYLIDKVDNETLEVTNHKLKVKAPLPVSKGGTGRKVMNAIRVPWTGQSQTITLPNPHSNANYVAIATLDLGSPNNMPGGNIIYQIAGQTSTSVTVLCNNNPPGVPYYWNIITIGD